MLGLPAAKLNERLFALWYPPVAGLSERAGQSETRRGLVAAAAGRTLELGAGSGYNLPYFTGSVSDLVVTEPSRHMVSLLRDQLESGPPPVASWPKLWFRCQARRRSQELRSKRPMRHMA